jgi:hypothetical protein
MLGKSFRHSLTSNLHKIPLTKDGSATMEQILGVLMNLNRQLEALQQSCVTKEMLQDLREATPTLSDLTAPKTTDAPAADAPAADKPAPDALAADVTQVPDSQMNLFNSTVGGTDATSTPFHSNAHANTRPIPPDGGVSHVDAHANGWSRVVERARNKQKSVSKQ